MSQKLHLLIVDPQNDFCIADDGHGNKGTLVVPGADADMSRVSRLIRRLGDKIDGISTTLDSHQTIGIERPRWWIRVSDGAEVVPFTCLGIHPDGKRIVKFNLGPTGATPTEEEYTTRIAHMLHNGGSTGAGSFGYLKALASRQRYPHIVWTEHCIVGTWGWSIVPELANTLTWWERQFMARVDYIVKGNNPWTEHFSGVKAEVPDPKDVGTQLNTHLIGTLEEADIVMLTGEALSHCVANTVTDIANAFADPATIRKLVLLTDCTSNVGGFDFLGQQFIADLTKKGMRLETSDSFLA